MKKVLTFITFFLISFLMSSQNLDYVSGIIINSKTNQPLENVNIVNLNEVIGTATSKEGQFEINAKVNDTLHLNLQN